MSLTFEDMFLSFYGSLWSDHNVKSIDDLWKTFLAAQTFPSQNTFLISECKLRQKS